MSGVVSRKPLSLPATVDSPPPDPRPDLSELCSGEIKPRPQHLAQRGAADFAQVVLKLDGWSDDLKLWLERELNDLDRQIREARKAASLAAGLQEKLDAQKAVKALEAERSKKRRDVFEAQDAIDRQRDELIGRIQRQLQSVHRTERLFMVRWTLT